MVTPSVRFAFAAGLPLDSVIGFVTATCCGTDHSGWLQDTLLSLRKNNVLVTKLKDQVDAMVFIVCGNSFQFCFLCSIEHWPHGSFRVSSCYAAVRLHIKASERALCNAIRFWDKSQPYLSLPVQRVVAGKLWANQVQANASRCHSGDCSESMGKWWV